MVARAINSTDYVIELIRDGKLVDACNCNRPGHCAQQAAVLIARVGDLLPGDIVLVRDFDGGAG